ncbi:hypothetical protein BH10PLA1_BH10PLA1_15510 [soil metagenome]
MDCFPLKLGEWESIPHAQRRNGKTTPRKKKVDRR